MESYIVRIYRRNLKKRRAVVGTVEEVGAEGKRAFSDFHQLWRILSVQNRPSLREGKQGRLGREGHGHDT